MKSQSIAYLPIGSAHIYWILDLEGEVHSIWDLWSSGLRECKGNFFSEVGRDGQHVSIRFKNFSKGLPHSGFDISKVREGMFNIHSC